jgi:alpha-glucosidase
VQEHDPLSTLQLYRQALAIRRERLAAGLHRDLHSSWIELGGDTDHVVAFERTDGLRCVVNMGEQPVALPAGTVVLASSPFDGSELPADTAVWLT